MICQILCCQRTWSHPPMIQKNMRRNKLHVDSILRMVFQLTRTQKRIMMFPLTTIRRMKPRMLTDWCRR